MNNLKRMLKINAIYEINWLTNGRYVGVVVSLIAVSMHNASFTNVWIPEHQNFVSSSKIQRHGFIGIVGVHKLLFDPQSDRWCLEVVVKLSRASASAGSWRRRREEAQQPAGDRF